MISTQLARRRMGEVRVTVEEVDRITWESPIQVGHKFTNSSTI
jgi:hypothetical protein